MWGFFATPSPTPIANEDAKGDTKMTSPTDVRQVATNDAAIELEPSAVTRIEPGTVIGKHPPRGWSHLLIQSRSRIAGGDVGSVNDTIKHLASFLFSAMVARVEKVNGRHVLCDVGFGIGTRIQDEDTIITTKTQAKLGAALGFLERRGLARAERRLPTMKVAAKSPTMAIVDGVTHLLRDEGGGSKHREAVIRHAVLVDPRTGNVDTLTWAIERQDGGGYGEPWSEIDWSPPGHQVQIDLHVDAREFAFGIITEKALAQTSMKHGKKQFPLPPGLATELATSRLGKAQFQRLEAGLRKLLAAETR